jgi:nicotinate-nucleotide pyrophosphorylase (carboxylating)
MSAAGLGGSRRDVDPPRVAVREAVSRALQEDLLPLGDITGALVSGCARAKGAFVSRGEGVVAGRLCVEEAFAQFDPEVELAWRLEDGSPVEAGSVLADVEGKMRSLLAAERTALNFLCHLSGVATLTRRYVEAVGSANSSTRVLDTRKTTPGLRALEKAAVRAGGGHNHRGSLSDAVLVKDNHLIGLGISAAVERAREHWPGRMVEVECDRLEQAQEAARAGASAVLLDNMSPDEVARCVESLGSGIQRAPLLVEVSGRVSLENAAAYAAAGADLISVGALTHSAPVLDIGLDIEGVV